MKIKQTIVGVLLLGVAFAFTVCGQGKSADETITQNIRFKQKVLLWL